MKYAISITIFLAVFPAFAQQSPPSDPAQDVFSDLQGNAVSQRHLNESVIALIKAYNATKSELEKLKASTNDNSSIPSVPKK